MKKVKKEVFDEAGFSIIEVDMEEPPKKKFEIDEAGIKPVSS
jgi:hypothetical protein